MRPRLAQSECLHCGVLFTPRKAGHVFHTPLCRHRGPREPHERRPIDDEQIARLFDESRDPAESARQDDWHPTPHLEFAELDAFDSLEQRRRWYQDLSDRGAL